VSERIVFLDIDGVLNNRRSRLGGIDPVHVEHLNTLVARTGAKVVISSTWRMAGRTAVAEDLATAGFRGKVIGVTPDLTRRAQGLWTAPERGTEIQEWLRQPSRTPHTIVILDDEADMGSLLPFLVQTDPLDGLTAQDVERAAAILEAQP
jgi:hypothetical protein